MAQMLAALGPRGTPDWELLDAVLADTVTIGTLYDAWQHDDLAGLRARLTDIDVTGHIDGWQRWLGDRVAPDTAQHYLVYLTTLMPSGEPFWRSALSAPTVARWLAARAGVSAGTKRKYLAAVQSFAKYLLEVGVLAEHPLRDVSPPPAADPRCHFLELPDVRRVVEGAPQPFRAMYALAYGAGLEVSAILGLVDADVDPVARQVRARGTKAWTRDRLARVADWAWPHVAEHLAAVLPGSRVFLGMDRWIVGEAHRTRVRALGLDGYRLHDARHHWAVRMARAGAPLELIARQLGHRDTAMCSKVYARFTPNTVERDRWEGVAASSDEAKWGRLVATSVATEMDNRVESREDSAGTADDAASYVNSRGGTRTRDPGIMSAVL